MDFGKALQALKTDHMITRTGWNGKGQYVYKISGNELSKMLGYGYGEYMGEPKFGNTLVLKTAQNDLVVGWVPSMGDLFAEDWETV